MTVCCASSSASIQLESGSDSEIVFDQAGTHSRFVLSNPGTGAGLVIKSETRDLLSIGRQSGDLRVLGNLDVKTHGDSPRSATVTSASDAASLVLTSNASSLVSVVSQNGSTSLSLTTGSSTFALQNAGLGEFAISHSTLSSSIINLALANSTFTGNTLVSSGYVEVKSMTGGAHVIAEAGGSTDEALMELHAPTNSHSQVLFARTHSGGANSTAFAITNRAGALQISGQDASPLWNISRITGNTWIRGDVSLHWPDGGSPSRSLNVSSPSGEATGEVISATSTASLRVSSANASALCLVSAAANTNATLHLGAFALTHSSHLAFSTHTSGELMTIAQSSGTTSTRGSWSVQSPNGATKVEVQSEDKQAVVTIEAATDAVTTIKSPDDAKIILTEGAAEFAILNQDQGNTLHVAAGRGNGSFTPWWTLSRHAHQPASWFHRNVLIGSKATPASLTVSSLSGNASVQNTAGGVGTSTITARSPMGMNSKVELSTGSNVFSITHEAAEGQLVFRGGPVDHIMTIARTSGNTRFFGNLTIQDSGSRHLTLKSTNGQSDIFVNGATDGAVKLHGKRAHLVLSKPGGHSFRLQNELSQFSLINADVSLMTIKPSIGEGAVFIDGNLTVSTLNSTHDRMFQVLANASATVKLESTSGHAMASVISDTLDATVKLTAPVHQDATLALRSQNSESSPARVGFDILNHGASGNFVITNTSLELLTLRPVSGSADLHGNMQIGLASSADATSVQLLSNADVQVQVLAGMNSKLKIEAGPGGNALLEISSASNAASILSLGSGTQYDYQISVSDEGQQFRLSNGPHQLLLLSNQTVHSTGSHTVIDNSNGTSDTLLHIEGSTHSATPSTLRLASGTAGEFAIQKSTQSQDDATQDNTFLSFDDGIHQLLRVHRHTGTFILRGSMGQTGVLYVENSTSRVGVNVESPKRDLHVGGDAAMSGDVTVSGKALNIYSDLHTVRLGMNKSDPANSNAAFQVKGNTALSGNLMVGNLSSPTFTVIGASGFIGINTVPQSQLHIVGSWHISGKSNMSNPFSLKVNTSLVVHHEQKSVRIGDMNGPMKNQTLHVVGRTVIDSNLRAASNTLTVNAASNNVAIGIAQTSVQLHVNGSAQVSESLNIGSTTLVVNAETQRVGIRTDVPLAVLDVAGDVLLSLKPSQRLSNTDLQIIGTDEDLLRLRGPENCSLSLKFQSQQSIGSLTGLLHSSKKLPRLSYMFANVTSAFFTHAGQFQVGPSEPQHMLSINGTSKFQNLSVGTQGLSSRLVRVGSRGGAMVGIHSKNSTAVVTLRGNHSGLLILNSSALGTSCLANLTLAGSSPLQLLHHAGKERFEISNGGGIMTFSNHNSTVSGNVAIEQVGPAAMNVTSSDSQASVLVSGSSAASLNIKAPSNHSASLQIASGETSFWVTSLAQQLSIGSLHDVVRVSGSTAETLINANTTVGCSIAYQSICAGARHLLVSATHSAAQVVVNGDAAQVSIRAQAGFNSMFQLQSGVGAFILKVHPDDRLVISDGTKALMSVGADLTSIAGNATFGGLGSDNQDNAEVSTQLFAQILLSDLLSFRLRSYLLRMQMWE